MCPGALIEGVTVPSSKGVPTLLYRASGLSAPPVGSKAGTDGTIPALASAAGCAPPVVVGGAVVDVVCLPDKGTALLPRTSTPGHLETTSGGVARNVADGMVRRDGLQPHVTGAATPCDRGCDPMRPGCNPMHLGCNPAHQGCDPTHLSQARLGAAPLLVSAVGADGLGEQILRELDELGVRSGAPRLAEGVARVEGRRTATYVAMMDGEGDLSAAVADRKI